MPREWVVVASGVAGAAIAAVGIWLLLGTETLPLPGQAKTGLVQPQPAALASPQLASCAVEPAAVAASDKDGHFPLQAGVEGLIAADITSFIAIGNDSAAAGRPRDAEAAFLMACRVADKLGGAGSVELADAKYQLAALYAKLALAGAAAGGADRAELLKRAEPLYRDSLQTSVVRYGEAHEKSQLAAKGLAAVRQALVPAATPTAKPAPAATATPAPAPVQAQIVPPPPPSSPSPAPVPKPAIRVEAAEKPPRPAPPVAVAAPAVRPMPPAVAPATTRQRPSAVKECLPAVAALGLCDPGT
jgi:hypothetical protein